MCANIGSIVSQCANPMNQLMIQLQYFWGRETYIAVTHHSIWLYIYTLWLFNITGWKIPTINGGLVRWENRLFLWTIYTMAMLVITRGYICIYNYIYIPSSWLHHHRYRLSLSILFSPSGNSHPATVVGWYTNDDSKNYDPNTLFTAPTIASGYCNKFLHVLFDCSVLNSPKNPMF
jgi:hypothetical protein